MAAPVPNTLAEAFERQEHACAALGSHLYARLLHGLAQDLARGGIVAELLEGRSDRPLHDAVPLRLLGAVHALVLAGQAPALARRYPSAGGADDGTDPTADFLAVVRAHREAIVPALDRTVQTNEVGRAAALAPAFVLLGRRHGLPLRLFEIGASAGLLLRWDGYRYREGDHHLGPASSPLVFEGAWEPPLAPLSPPVAVVGRRGCDVAPLDASRPDAARRLESFVWPDQDERRARLRAALAVARRWPVPVDAADAGDWLSRVLPERDARGVTTVVFHAIVWQYLAPATRQRVRDALAAAAEQATATSPLAWLRLEPAGAVADLRLTTWPEGHEEVLATSGYHGPPVRWTVSGD